MLRGFLSLTCGIAGAFFLFTALAASPQSLPASSTTFSSNSELVMVPVHVTDHYGRPVRGLKKQDFVLKSDGTPQRIALFEEVQSASVPASTPPPVVEKAAAHAPATFSNARATEIPQQLVILALDSVNTPAPLQGWTRDQLIKYLQANPPRQPTEVVAITYDGLRQVQAFTTDTAALIDSVRKMRSHITANDQDEPLMSHMDQSGRIDTYGSLVRAAQQREADKAAANIDTGSATLRSFEQLAWAYSGVPGRKTVLWLTTGFPIVQEVPDGPAMLGRMSTRTGAPSRLSGSHLSNELLPEFQRAFTAMNKADVVVYPVDVNGLPTDSMWDPSLPGAMFVHSEMSHLYPGLQMPGPTSGSEGMKELAHRTGGKSCTAGNSVSFCLDQALAESSDYYLLGFYVSQQGRKLGWHKLKVSLEVDHGEVRARNSYYLRALGSPQQWEREEDLRSAMYAAVDYTGILFSVQADKPANRSNSAIVFKVSVPASSIVLEPGQEKLSFDVIAIPLSKTGTPVGTQSPIVKLDIAPEVTPKALAKGWNLIDKVAANSSITAVKVIVRDNATGRIGSVIFPVTEAAAGS